MALKSGCGSKGRQHLPRALLSSILSNRRRPCSLPCPHLKLLSLHKANASQLVAWRTSFSGDCFLLLETSSVFLLPLPTSTALNAYYNLLPLESLWSAVVSQAFCANKRSNVPTSPWSRPQQPVRPTQTPASLLTAHSRRVC